MFDGNLWPTSYTCSLKKHKSHMKALCEAKAGVREYLEQHHEKLWTRCKFGHECKVDYVTSNIAKCFNAKVKSLKGLVVWEIFDKISLLIMDKMELRKRIAEFKYVGHIIIPSVVMGLNALAKELHLNLRKSSAEEGEVSYMSKDGQEWRHTMQLGNKTCRCN